MGYVTVFDRVVMDVVQAALEVHVAAHELFPVATLPDASFLLALATLRAPFVLGQAAREA